MCTLNLLDFILVSCGVSFTNNLNLEYDSSVQYFCLTNLVQLLDF
uniref:Uncharacterized protein n=1 Tax=Anguilla anguilla TaxID=7936 RepID=A0A0E9WE49_ANGAN